VKPGEPSRTAIEVAAARAAHLRYDPAPHFIEDRVAWALLGDEADEIVARYADGAPWILLENRLFLPFRARFAEDVIAQSHARGVRQVVVLGAGLDSLALRLPPALADLSIFEVDHPATQAWKRERLEKSGFALPETLELVACDFETTSVGDALRRSRFRGDAPAVVTWMGVVYYLARETFERALAELHATLAPGSSVVLDYMFPVSGLSQRYRELHEQMTTHLRGFGEPQVNRQTPGELRESARAAGFVDAALPERSDLFRRYFAPLRSPIPMSERFGLAVLRRT